MDRQNYRFIDNWRSCFKFRREPQQDLSGVPYIIISDFEKSSEADCIKMDNKNERIYNSLLNKALRAEKTIENSGLSMNLEVPIPPHPNNRDRFILWKKRNICRHVIEQSEAVVFLERSGYKLNKHYEAYQAIELSKEIKRTKGIKEATVDKSKDFNNIYNKRDKNILRRKSMYGRQHNLKPIYLNSDDDDEHEDKYGFPGVYRNESKAPNYNEFSSFQIQHQNQYTAPTAPTAPTEPSVQQHSNQVIASAPPLKIQSHPQQFIHNNQFPEVNKPSAPPATRATNMKPPKSPNSPGSDNFYPTLNI
jgi:hypothetical protein